MIITIIIILLILLFATMILNGILLIKYKEESIIINIPQKKIMLNWSKD